MNNVKQYTETHTVWYTCRTLVGLYLEILLYKFGKYTKTKKIYNMMMKVYMVQTVVVGGLDIVRARKRRKEVEDLHDVIGPACRLQALQ